MHWQTFLNLEKGSPIMWVLFIVSFFGFVIFVERLLFLHKGQIRTQDFLAGIKNLVRKRRLIEALTVCEETPGPVAGVVKSALLHHDDRPEDLRLAIQSAALVEIPILERRVATIAAVARIAPLLGLLGTVLAMMTTYSAIPSSGTVAYPTLGSLLGGVGDALATTALGITIAIMAHAAHHLVAGRIKALVGDMEYSGHDIMQFLLKDVPEEEPESTPVDSK